MSPTPYETWTNYVLSSPLYWSWDLEEIPSFVAQDRVKFQNYLRIPKLFLSLTSFILLPPFILLSHSPPPSSSFMFYVMADYNIFPNRRTEGILREEDGALSLGQAWQPATVQPITRNQVEKCANFRSKRAKIPG